jgi:hypothetical protein
MVMPIRDGLLILLAAVFGTGAMVMAGAWFLGRLRRLEGDAARNAELVEQVELLRAELAQARDELGELVGRVDFAERLLTRGDPPRPPSGN